MILANDFLEYLLNTERDLAVRVRERYDMYLKSLPVECQNRDMAAECKTVLLPRPGIRTYSGRGGIVVQEVAV